MKCLILLAVRGIVYIITNHSGLFMDNILNFSDALEVFYQIADTENFYHYNRLICLARRLYIADEIKRLTGVTASKISAFAPTGDMLMPQGKEFINAIGGLFYHVAATAPVLWESGNTVQMAFNPTLFDAPVSKNQWGKHLGADHNALAKGVLEGSVYVSNKSYRQLSVDFRYERARRFLYQHSYMPLGGQKRVVSVSGLANRYFERPREIRRRRFAKTWTTDKRFGLI